MFARPLRHCFSASNVLGVGGGIWLRNAVADEAAGYVGATGDPGRCPPAGQVTVESHACGARIGRLCER